MGYTNLFTTFIVLFGGALAQLSDKDFSLGHRDNNGWCDEARTKAIEMIETCYADEQCCQLSSQCANGCCGADQYCHTDCFSDDGENLHDAPISLIEYNILQGRPECKKTVENVKDEQKERAEKIVRLVSFLIWAILMVVGFVCCIRATNRHSEEKKLIDEAKKKLKLKV